MIKTVKLKADEYFHLDEVLPLPYFLIGGRGTGKSYFVKNYIKKLLLESDFNDKYMYTRVSNQEVKTHDSWLQESGITEELPFDAQNTSIVRGKPFAGGVSLKYSIPTGIEYKHIGYVTTLESSALAKSGYFGDVKAIVFEEFIRRGMSGKQIDEYCFNFMELVETVLRGRPCPIFFIANSLNAYNPLLTLFKDYMVVKIFSEQRRENISEGRFSEYLRGETYNDRDYNLADFDFLFSIKTKERALSIYSDRFRHRDIVVTNAYEKNKKERLDIVFAMQRELLYNFSQLNFYFDREQTEVYFYSNITEIKSKIRNRLTALLNV